MKKIILSAAIFCLFAFKAWSQAEEETAKPLTFSGYAEIYYSYDFQNPLSGARLPFNYSHNRHNEFNLNLGFVKAAYSTDRVRANLALMAGTYANDNLAAELDVMKNIYEANVGFKISKSKNLWIDAGIFAAHIGAESAISKDCWALTRTLCAENSPYYESGAKITYTTDDGKWLLSGLILNGWQRMYRPIGNSTPAFGHQIMFKPNDKITLNSSSFVGSDKPDITRQMRYFHNFYSIFQLNEKIGLSLGFDYGMEQVEKGSSDYNTWYTPYALLRITPNDKVALCIRGEYYKDEKGVIIATGTDNGFQTMGYSLNFDYKIADNLLWRIEGRGFSSKDAIFDSGKSKSNVFATTSLAISF
ncbi:MAG: porin [Cytophagales bacterium]|nr:MAG: porin [Cytophagales bacterium]TAF62565.1 MAG: porin [Cytophagales bacterium]